MAAGGFRGDVCWGEGIGTDLDVKECLVFQSGCAEAVDAGSSVGKGRIRDPMDESGGWRSDVV